MAATRPGVTGSASDRGTRSLAIDSLRGLACVMLVAYHVIGQTGSAGLQIGIGPIRDINDLLGLIRMPLFTFLSGIVYGWRPYTGHARAFVAGKARRLLVPMLVVGTAFALLQQLTPGHHGQAPHWATLHLIPVAHYWFVEALFLIFLAIVPLEHYGLLRTPSRMLLAIAVAAAAFVPFFQVNWLAIGGALNLFPYFLLGLSCSRFQIIRIGTASPLRAAGSFALIAAAAAAYGSVWSINDSGWAAMSACLLVSSVSCMLFLASGFRSRVLAWVGRSSYTIYLFHVFFAAATRIALQRAGVGEFATHLIVGTATGVLLSMLIERVFARNRYTAALLLGRSPLSEANESAADRSPPPRSAPQQ